MTSTTVAEITWRALDREGRDSCRLVQHDDGWMLLGHARFRTEDGASELDYLVRCDADWHTIGADVTGLWAGQRVALHITREQGEWRLNRTAQPQVAEARDIDFAFTPATNLMPLRRLPEIGSIEAQAAWLRDPGTLEPMGQRYTRGRGGLVHYRSPQLSCDLLVDPTGFVTRYPGLWEAVRAP
ncbi:putative glycolipid-binding domain-containing protein [Roseivivax sediminis]|uniref:Glycolipid-binding n=1 Tax=Roseivivax sediminis TaxID=936889 RepID=A0A1I1U4F0_9RHOB|nr:putative glycolipid-binding domain-containing protein [Roseivivax sediminis]SFD65682.1 hypothetical protein SAMN04515678_102148 [Roseivivax sediminis]